jgi:hypothetical protein
LIRHRLLQNLATGPDTLFFAGDLGQRIFQEPFSWKALGIDIRGRSKTLMVNYRISHQIRQAADRLLPKVLQDVDGVEQDRRGTVSVFNGPEPEIRTFAGADAEVQGIADWIKSLVADGEAPAEIDLFVQSNGELSRARAAVKVAGHVQLELSEDLKTRKAALLSALCTLPKVLNIKRLPSWAAMTTCCRCKNASRRSLTNLSLMRSMRPKGISFTWPVRAPATICMFRVSIPPPSFSATCPRAGRRVRPDRPRRSDSAMATKEDILEQIVEEYLVHKGYFVQHNIKFLPRKDHPDFVLNQDSNHSDIDVIGYHPLMEGDRKVVAVICKSWQSGFNRAAEIRAIEGDKVRHGRKAWQAFRELTSPKWSEGFVQAGRDATGAERFAHVTDVAKLVGSRNAWENYQPFRAALDGNPATIITFREMVTEIQGNLTTTLASTEVGRMLQMFLAADMKVKPD